MVLTRRQALAQMKNQPTNQATTATFEVDDEPLMDVVCKDAVEGSADIYVTAKGTVADNDGALHTYNLTENDQTDRSPSAQPQEEFDHQDKENKGGLKSFQPQTNKRSNPSTSIQSNEGNSANSASLLNEERKEPDVHRRHRERTASGARSTELTPSEGGSATNTEAEAKVESKQVEKDEEARGKNNIEESPAEGSVRRSQRVRRPTQRYIAATRNDDSGRRRGSAKEDLGRQRSTQTRGSPKRKRCDSSTTDEDFAEQEETRRIRRRTEEDDCALVWSHMTQSQYAWMCRLDHRRIALRPREEVPGMGSWNRFTVPRPISSMRDINEERWRALIQVAVEAKRLEV